MAVAKTKTISGVEQERELLRAMAGFRYDPEGYVLYNFPWGRGILSKHKGPRKWQRKVLREIGRKLIGNADYRLDEAVKIARASGHGIGKAQPKTLMLHTPDGYRSWGDIQVGDTVFGVDGQPVVVLARHEQGIKPTYLVSFDDGSSTLTCAEHVWTVRGRSGRRGDGAAGRTDAWSEMTTADILSAGVKRSNGVSFCRQWELPTSGSVAFTPQSIPVDAYVLGLWLGDGCRNRGLITNIEPEIESQLTARGYKFSIGGKQGTKAKSLGIYGLHAHLKALGIFDKYSYEKSVPAIYKHNSAEVRAELLRGLLDTDGACGKGNGTIVFSSTSKALADDVVWLARSLGGKARISPTVKSPYYRDKDGVKVDCRPCYNATLTMPHGFKSFYVSRKQERVPDVQARYLSRWITSIEPYGEEDCMCITVSNPDGLYLTNDFIVTHNSALVAWVIKWGLDTLPDTRVVITANTESQLKTKTWPELTKWHNLSLTKHWFLLKGESLQSTQQDHDKLWRADAIPWSEKNPEAFAGLHNEGKRIIVIFDEASAIIDRIWEVAEGAMTDADTEIIWAVFGNPTRNTGRFRECFRKWRHRWDHEQIDSRTVEGTNLKFFEGLVSDFGEDSDIVKVRVRGMFPSASLQQMIPTDLVDAAFGKELRDEQYKFAPVIITCDPAWSGGDELVIGMRQGLHFRVLRTMAKNTNDMVPATVIANFEDQYSADAVFIDFGFGTGIVSAGQAMGRDWVGVWFNGESADPGCVNKRAEMWKLMRDWLGAGGAIPNDQTLYSDLISPELRPRVDGKIMLESKDDMRKRGLPSPGRGDALALSFAFPVQARSLADVYIGAEDSRNSYADFEIFQEVR